MITLKTKHKQQDKTRNPVQTHPLSISFLTTPYHINAYHTYNTLLQTHHEHHKARRQTCETRANQTINSKLQYTETINKSKHDQIPTPTHHHLSHTTRSNPPPRQKTSKLDNPPRQKNNQQSKIKDKKSTLDLSRPALILSRKHPPCSSQSQTPSLRATILSVRN